MDSLCSNSCAGSTCRGCGGQNAVKPLSVYGNVFKWCTSIEFSSSDGLPSNICNQCWEMLTVSYKFKVLCTRTDRQFRLRNNGEFFMENIPALEIVSADEFAQFETADDMKTDEIVEETILHSKEPFEELYKVIPEIEECITTEEEELKENEVSESEDVSNGNHLLPEGDKSDETLQLVEEECNKIIDQEVREDEEEFLHEDAVEYLEDSFKELTPPHEPSSGTISIVVLESSPKPSKSRTVRHSCPDCGKYFSSRTNVVRHQHSHRDSKPYQCDICKKEFTQSGSLKTHRYSHFDIKPFVCNVCGKRFTQSKSVKLHLRCHTGEKPYVCDICNAAFRQKNGLQRHMKVHGERR